MNHPDHYNSGRFEAIDVIEDACGDAFEGFLVGNVLKYLLRYRHKNGVEDLRKAQWYLNRLIEKKDGEWESQMS